MTMVARASQISENHSGPLDAECGGDGIDHPVAVDEDEAPGQGADDGRHHQWQGNDGAENFAAFETAMEGECHGKADDRLQHKARRDKAERVPEGGLKIRRGRNAGIVVQALEVGRATKGRVGTIEAEPKGPAHGIEHGQA